MRSLADHYSRCRVAFPHDRLLVVFDIDGTILDMRHMVHHVLVAYDRAHGTDLFADLTPEAIDVHENQVDRFLARWVRHASLRDQVHRWYLEQRWEPAAVLEAHRPFQGVMEVIRWFQLQPATFVGLNTGRPESLRAETLRSLNALGHEYRVSFSDDLLQMNPDGWSDDVTAPKEDGIRAFEAAGYRVVAVIDNEPANIEALAAADTAGDILFLHAQTFYESQRTATPRTVEGSSYDIRSLIAERDLPRHVQLVWHGVNDRANLRHFLGSSVHWGEVDVRWSARGELMLQHDPAGKGHAPGRGANGSDQSLPVAECLAAFAEAGKGIKLDIKDRAAVDGVLEQVARSGLEGDRLWFNGRIDRLGDETFSRVAAAHPQAIVQCPIDFLGPLMVAAPHQAKLVLQLLAGWGMNRFSVSWADPQMRTVLDRLDEWGYAVNIYAVPDLEQFLRAALLLPRSITADFNFPEWHYFGRGSGESGRYHQYQIETLASPGSDLP